MEPVFSATSDEWRRWLEARYDCAAELWVGFHGRATGRPGITWPEAVDQALCFGWIDGIRRGLDGERYTIRSTPRRRDSTWSAANLRRHERQEGRNESAASGHSHRGLGAGPHHRAAHPEAARITGGRPQRAP